MAERRSTASPGGPGHGHGHGHESGAASRGVRRLLALLLVPFALAAIVGAVLLYPGNYEQPGGPERRPVDGVIVSAAAGPCTRGTPADSGGSDCLHLRVRLEGGPAAGTTIEQTVPTGPTTPEFAVHDAVVLAYTGADPKQPSSYQIVDFQRGGWLLTIVGLFVAAVLLLGRWKGLTSLLALAVSFLVLVGFVFPAILAGRDPLAVAVTGSGLIMFAVLYLTHGFSARTSAAVLGTMLSLSLIGLLSALFAALTNLTGLSESTSVLISALGSDIDTRGLLLAGIVIGALGVLDDVTVTQTSAVWELHGADPTMSWWGLYSAGLRIGRDHVASAVNTLVLAYAGAALPLLLTYTLSGSSFTEIVTTQAVAQEVVRTLVGSIGLVAAVPATTAIAAAIVRRGSGEPAGNRTGGSHTDEHTVAHLVRRAAVVGAARPTTPAARAAKPDRRAPL